MNELTRICTSAWFFSLGQGQVPGISEEILTAVRLFKGYCTRGTSYIKRPPHIHKLYTLYMQEFQSIPTNSPACQGHLRMFRLRVHKLLVDDQK